MCIYFNTLTLHQSIQLAIYLSFFLYICIALCCSLSLSISPHHLCLFVCPTINQHPLPAPPHRPQISLQDQAPFALFFLKTVSLSSLSLCLSLSLSLSISLSLFLSLALSMPLSLYLSQCLANLWVDRWTDECVLRQRKTWWTFHWPGVACTPRRSG